MKIREFKTDDAFPASEIIKECFLHQKLGDYSVNIIQGQINDNSPEKLIEYSKDTKYFVALDGNSLVGIGGYNKIKVRTLFIRIDFQKRGVGKFLLSTILREASKDGIVKLTCWSTIFAEQFYQKNGFKTIKDLKIPYRNETLIFKEMEIVL